MPPGKMYKSRSRKSANRKKGYTRSRPYSTRAKKSKYAPRKKQAMINRSNPIAENKQVVGSEFAATVGLGQNGNPIFTDFSVPPRYLNTEPDYDGELVIKNFPTGAQGFPLNTPVWHFNPDSALYQTHGFDESQMVGRSTYQRLCAAKFLIKWPQPSMNTGHLLQDLDPPDNTDPYDERAEWIARPSNNIDGRIPETPQNYHLYWGFVNTKMGLSGFTTPTATTCTAQDIENHINLRVQDFFNERKDRLQFIPKTSNTMQIIGKKKITPPWSTQSGRTPVSSIIEVDNPNNVKDFHGSIPDTLIKIKWPLNRKIHFQPTNLIGGTNQQLDGSTPTVFYKNWDWMPFAVIVNYNIDHLPEDVVPAVNDNSYERTRRVPQVLVNDITYYRDS